MISNNAINSNIRQHLISIPSGAAAEVVVAVVAAWDSEGHHRRVVSLLRSS